MAISTQQSSHAGEAGKVHYGRFLTPDNVARPCEVRNLRGDGASLSVRDTVAEDTPIVLYIHGIGRRQARVIAAYERGMDVCFVQSGRARREAVGDASECDRAIVERRRHERINPANRRHSILLPGGETHACDIVDVSQSGVLVSLDRLLPIGAIVEIAGLAGRVSDRREDGTVIKFEDDPDQAKLAQLIR